MKLWPIAIITVFISYYSTFDLRAADATAEASVVTESPLVASPAPKIVPLTKELAQQRAYKGKYGRIPGTIPAVNFDEGEEGTAFSNIGPIHDPTPKGPGVRADGLAWRKTPVEIEIGWGVTQIAAMKAGEWLTYSVDVAKEGIYDLELEMSGTKQGDQASAIRIEFDGEDKTGELTVPYTGKWYIFKTLHKEGISLKAGFQTMRVVVTRGSHSMNLADIRFVPADIQAFVAPAKK